MTARGSENSKIFDIGRGMVLFAGFSYLITLPWLGFDSSIVWIPYLAAFLLSTATFSYGKNAREFRLSWHSFLVCIFGLVAFSFVIKENLNYENIYLSFYVTCLFFSAYTYVWYIMIFGKREKNSIR